ncbi:hypothetical protein J6590_031515 [Homalodisca vitripennis]|nr:hypothetical protein J6590_031515 [Homalodisca vitripennis]
MLSVASLKLITQEHDELTCKTPHKALLLSAHLLSPSLFIRKSINTFRQKTLNS